MYKAFRLYEITYLYANTGAVSEYECYVWASSKREAHVIWLIMALQGGWNYAAITKCTYNDMKNDIAVVNQSEGDSHRVFDIIDMHEALNNNPDYIRAQCERARVSIPKYTDETWEGCKHTWTGTGVYSDADYICPRCRARKDDYGIWHPNDIRPIRKRPDGTCVAANHDTWWMRFVDAIAEWREKHLW